MDQLTDRNLLTHSHRFGERTEQRFLKALAEWHSKEPLWFFGVEQAPPAFDIRGVDFFAWIRYPGSREVRAVPVQVKSSERRAKDYLEKHPLAKSAKVVVLVVKPEDTPAQIRTALYAKLVDVRSRNTSYKEFLWDVGTKPISGKARRFLEGIERRRQKREDKLLAPQPRLVLCAPQLNALERAWYATLALVRNRHTPAP